MRPEEGDRCQGAGSNHSASASVPPTQGRSASWQAILAPEQAEMTPATLPLGRRYGLLTPPARIGGLLTTSLPLSPPRGGPPLGRGLGGAQKHYRSWRLEDWCFICRGEGGRSPSHRRPGTGEPSRADPYTIGDQVALLSKALRGRPSRTRSTVPALNEYNHSQRVDQTARRKGVGPPTQPPAFQQQLLITDQTKPAVSLVIRDF